jgi:hypothetical protein
MTNSNPKITRVISKPGIVFFFAVVLFVTAGVAGVTLVLLVLVCVTQGGCNCSMNAYYHPRSLKKLL